MYYTVSDRYSTAVYCTVYTTEYRTNLYALYMYGYILVLYRLVV